jgi:hypothetical protein
MYKLKSPLNKLKILSVLILMVINVYGILLQTPKVSADTDVSPDPLWMPQIIPPTTIARHGENVYHYVLQAGKVYHIFLVGNWTEPVPKSTDYDVYVTAPNGEKYRFTESKGLPEQVANDKNGQLFVPSVSGQYTFEVHNDSEDSVLSAEGAVFMIIEHVQSDTTNSAVLMGRTTKNGLEPASANLTYACEFIASSEFAVHVDVPDDLDLYEVRLYKMATLGEHGHDINGIATPLGTDLLGNVTDSYGGYNFDTDGVRAPVYASCYDYGVDVDLTPFKEGFSASGNPTTYFLVFIAEYSKSAPGTISYYIKTDNTLPEPTLFIPIGPVYSGEPMVINADVSTLRELSQVWVNYTVNGVPASDSFSLGLDNEHYIGAFPGFNAKDQIDYTISAMDELGNVGTYASSFSVKDRTATTCNLSSTSITGGDAVEVVGMTTSSGASISLNFTCGSNTEIAKVKSDSFGSYSYSFTPKQVGQWSVEAVYDGDDVHYSSSSAKASFEMKPRFTSISYSVTSPNVNVRQPFELVGKTFPAQAGIPIEALLSSGSVMKTLSLTTLPDGSFKISELLDEGQWDVVVKVKGNWRFASSSSGVIHANILPLSLTEVFIEDIASLATPPYIYVTILASGIVLALLVRWKSSYIAPRLPAPLRALLTKFSLPKTPKKHLETLGRERYKRRTDELDPDRSVD